MVGEQQLLIWNHKESLQHEVSITNKKNCTNRQFNDQIFPQTHRGRIVGWRRLYDISGRFAFRNRLGYRWIHSNALFLQRYIRPQDFQRFLPRIYPRRRNKFLTLHVVDQLSQVSSHTKVNTRVPTSKNRPVFSVSVRCAETRST